MTQEKLSRNLSAISKIGDVIEAIDEKYYPFCKFKGEIFDLNEIEKYYNEAHILLLTSSREGFPLVIMEAMAHGVVPISTDVGGISEHIKDNVTGILIQNTYENDIIDGITKSIVDLHGDNSFLNIMSLNAYEYARNHFNSSKFCNAYRKLLLDLIKR